MVLALPEQSSTPPKLKYDGIFVKFKNVKTRTEHFLVMILPSGKISAQ